MNRLANPSFQRPGSGPAGLARRPRRRGLQGKSTLELLVAMGMLGISLLLAVPNLLPTLRNSNDRHHVDALGFFIDDLRKLSAATGVDVDVDADLGFLKKHRALLEERYPRLAKNTSPIEVLQPFQFLAGVFTQSERVKNPSDFGRLLFKGQTSWRIVDVVANGTFCTFRAQKEASLFERPACSRNQNPARGCNQGGGGGMLWGLALVAFLGFLPVKKNARFVEPRTPRKYKTRAGLRGYLLIEAVASALLLTLCVGLTYAYIARSRVRLPSERLQADSVQVRAAQHQQIWRQLHRKIQQPPEIWVVGQQKIETPHREVHTLRVLQRRGDLVLLELSIGHLKEGQRASTQFWSSKNKVLFKKKTENHFPKNGPPSTPRGQP